MLTFSYEARNTSTGEKIRATVSAESEKSAAKLLRDQGLVPLSMKLQHKRSGGFSQRVRTKDKVIFSRQLATLINAGLPLVQSLRSVVKQTTSKPMQVVINQVIADVESGMSFSTSLAKHPKVFNKVFISLVAASETSGTLDKGLERIANQQEKDADILSKIRGALIYPVVVLVVMLAVVTFMLVKVLPQVESIYSGLPGVSLPITTRLLLAVSHFITHYWWIVAIVVFVMGVLGTRYSRSIAGKKVMDTIKMRAWPFGRLYMKSYMARFCRTAATLVGSGVPLLQVIDITGEAVNNVNIQKSLENAADKVKGGKALSDALSNDRNFLELVPNMIKIGEQSGSLEKMLDQAASYYEKEVDNELKNISTIIEPALMVIMGIVALIIVAAILLPIYGLINQPTFTNNL